MSECAERVEEHVSSSNRKHTLCTARRAFAARTIASGDILAPIDLKTVFSRLLRCSSCRSQGILVPTLPLVFIHLHQSAVISFALRSSSIEDAFLRIITMSGGSKCWIHDLPAVKDMLTICLFSSIMEAREERV